MCCTITSPDCRGHTAAETSCACAPYASASSCARYAPAYSVREGREKGTYREYVSAGKAVTWRSCDAPKPEPVPPARLCSSSRPSSASQHSTSCASEEGERERGATCEDTRSKAAAGTNAADAIQGVVAPPRPVHVESVRPVVG